MLQHIRDKSQGVLAWTVVVLLIGTFALWGIHSYITGEKNTDAAAWVNHAAITPAEVSTVYQRLRQQYQLQMGANFSLSQSAEAALKQEALNQLILAQVLSEAAFKTGYRVTTNQVDEALVKIPAFQVNGQFSANRFHDILNGILYTQDQFLADMRKSMLINQVQGGYVNSAFALPNEVATAVKLVNQKRDISYVIIPAAHFMKEISVSPQEVKEYYTAHQAEFRSPEQVSIEYLALSQKDIKNQLHFDPSKLQQYYENNTANYTTPAAWHVAAIMIKFPEGKETFLGREEALRKANKIYDELKTHHDDPALFAKLASQYSEDAVSSKKGGELNWFTAGTLDPAFEKAAASLQKPGDFTAPVKTAYGYSIIKLLGEKKSSVLPFDTVRDKVQAALAQQQAEQLFSAQTDKLSNLTYANPNSLEVAAKALNLPLQTSPLFGREGAKTGVLSNPRVIAAAFSPDVLKQGNNSDVIQLDPDTVIVLRVKTHEPASVLPLADVQNTLSMTLKHQKAEQDAALQGEKLITRLRNEHPSLSRLASEAGFSVQEDNNAGRYDTKVDGFILAQAFRMPRPSAQALSAKGVPLPSGDYVIIVLNNVRDGELSASDTIQQRIFQEELESGEGRAAYQLYVREMIKKAKVKLNPDNSAGNKPPVNE